tara:strand:- start:27947 stop:28372 length:426 start_codon:yes stop_codon:yes gene_type:complete
LSTTILLLSIVIIFQFGAGGQIRNPPKITNINTPPKHYNLDKLMIFDIMFRIRKNNRWFVVASNFDEFKNDVRRVLRDNRDAIRRNFPNVVYKQLAALSDGALPPKPSLIYAEEWKGWRDDSFEWLLYTRSHLTNLRQRNK